MVRNVNLVIEESIRERKELTGATWVGLLLLGLETKEKEIREAKEKSELANAKPSSTGRSIQETTNDGRTIVHPCPEPGKK